MSLPFYGLEALVKYVHYPYPHSKLKVCCFSYHDLIAKPEDIAKLFDLPLQSLPIREDSAEILEWHKAQHLTKQVVDTKGLFELLGFEFTCFDIVKSRGCEDIVDLNFPVDEKWWNRFDLVIENSIEHCFYVGAAFSNCFQVTKKNGYIFHLNPLVMVNHSFYSFSPTLYFDFYEKNNCTVVHYEMFEGIQLKERIIPFSKEHYWKRYRNMVQKDSMQICIAKKNTDEININFPTQKKFQLYPNCKITR